MTTQTECAPGADAVDAAHQTITNVFVGADGKALGTDGRRWALIVDMTAQDSDTPCAVLIVREGMRGYERSDITFEHHQDCERACTARNQREGLGEDDVARIVASSMRFAP